MHLIDWRRLLLAAPIIAVVAVAVYFVTRDDAASDTPGARLAETPPGVTDDVGVQRGELARDFVATSPDGSDLRLSALRGRPTIINFWATWCTSCLAELPDFKQLQERVGREHLNVVAVNAGENKGDADEFLDALNADGFYVGFDPTLVVADAYGVGGLPTSLFLDADGVIRGIYTGHLRSEDMSKYLDAANAGRDASDENPRIRLVTTVARDHVLEVDEVGEGRADFRSKSLRCDDSYCATDAVGGVLRVPGILSTRFATSEDPPRLSVEYTETIALDEITAIIVDALNALGDPLYERPLEVIER